MRKFEVLIPYAGRAASPEFAVPSLMTAGSRVEGRTTA
jgi:hypothetical protein